MVVLVSSNASHSPKVGKPRRMSTITSTIPPRERRTSFAAPCPDLEVHAADDALARAGVVVLDHSAAMPEVAEDVAAIRLVEEAALVAEDAGLDAGSGPSSRVSSRLMVTLVVVVVTQGWRRAGPLARGSPRARQRHGRSGARPARSETGGPQHAVERAVGVAGAMTVVPGGDGHVDAGELHDRLGEWGPARRLAVRHVQGARDVRLEARPGSRRRGRR